MGATSIARGSHPLSRVREVVEGLPHASKAGPTHRRAWIGREHSPQIRPFASARRRTGWIRDLGRGAKLGARGVRTCEPAGTVPSEAAIEDAAAARRRGGASARTHVDIYLSRPLCSSFRKPFESAIVQAATDMSGPPGGDRSTRIARIGPTDQRPRLRRRGPSGNHLGPSRRPERAV